MKRNMGGPDQAGPNNNDSEAKGEEQIVRNGSVHLKKNNLYGPKKKSTCAKC